MARRNLTTVELLGLTEAKAALAELPEAFREVVADTFQVGGAIIAAEADARVPVAEIDGGTLRDSGDMHTRTDGLQVSVGYSDPKARWVEFATVDTPAQPFLWPGFRIGAKYVRAQMRLWTERAGQKVRARVKRFKRPRAAA